MNDPLEDLSKARELQMSLLPQMEYRSRRLELAASFEPCDRLGGDMFGYTELGGGLVAVFVFDVAGHGVVAAMYTVALRLLIEQSGLMGGGTPKGRLTSAMARLRRTFGGMKTMATVWMGIIDPGENYLLYCSMGHPPAIWACGDEIRLLESRKEEGVSSPPIGYSLPGDVTVRHVPFEPGSRLVIYTDGVSDAENRDAIPLGTDGIVKCFRGEDLPASIVRDKIHAAAMEHCNGKAFSDDFTLVVLRRTESGPASRRSWRSKR